MRSRIHEHHRTDDGKPAGGQTWGNGFSIAWQDGPLGRGIDRIEPNGAFVEDVIAAALGRIEFYQNSGFACDENHVAIVHLRDALQSLNDRTERRERQQVEGTHQGS